MGRKYGVHRIAMIGKVLKKSKVDYWINGNRLQTIIQGKRRGPKREGQKERAKRRGPKGEGQKERAKKAAGILKRDFFLHRDPQIL